MSLNVPPLQRNLPIAGDLPPSPEFHVWWQNFIKALLDTINQQQEQLTQLQAAFDAAEGARKSAARIGSYTVPTNVLTSTDTGGGTANILIAAHQRVYPSNSALPPVSIEAGSISSLLNSTDYYVYYDDPTLADMTPDFVATTNAATAQVGAGISRHFLGKITTAAGGGGSTGGSGGTPPGGGGGPIP